VGGGGGRGVGNKWWLVGVAEVVPDIHCNGVEQLAVTEAFLGCCCTLLPGNGLILLPLALVPLFVVFLLHGPIDYRGGGQNGLEIFTLITLRFCDD